MSTTKCDKNYYGLEGWVAKDCSRCGFELPPTFRIKSKHTGLYYCADLGGCKRRARNELTWEEIEWLANKARRAVTCNASKKKLVAA